VLDRHSPALDRHGTNWRKISCEAPNGALAEADGHLAYASSINVDASSNDNVFGAIPGNLTAVNIVCARGDTLSAVSIRSKALDDELRPAGGSVDTWGGVPVRLESRQMNDSSIGLDAAVANEMRARRVTPNFVASNGYPETTQFRPIIEADAAPARRIKVLFANKFFFLNGGSEVVMFDEMQLMRKFQVDVAEISMRDPRNLPSKYERYFISQKSYRSGSRVQKVKAALSFVHSREAVKNITRLIRNEKPDILHCHNIYHQLTPSIINAAARLQTPVVLTLHDYKPVCPAYTQLRNGEPCTECSNGGFESVVKYRCAGSVGQSALLWAEARYHAAIRSYHHVDKFIAPSRFMRDAIVRRFGEDKVIHIPNGIDVSRIDPADGDDGYVLFLGRLSKEKGVETLLRAHAADNAAWHLVIAGTGPLLDRLRSQYPLAEFTGHLSGDALKARIRGASLVVVPSEWHENSPISILEAMAYAKPVVASRIGGIPELVRHGRTGLLFEPKDARELSGHIRTLLEDSNLRRRLGREARSTIESEYSIQKHGAALLALYESLTSDRSKTGS
jgi:glycosyltransferase involved in cell wall biosynthesis